MAHPESSTSSSTLSITVECNFTLEGAKDVALVWDGHEHPIENEGGRYEAIVEVRFENTKPKKFHFRVDGEESNGHLCYPSFLNTTYTMSPKRCLSIIATIVSQGLTPEKRQEVLEESRKALDAAREKLRRKSTNW
ncbi:hypothetical protein DL98DRAFT_521485 [Cadophora sp. DSE1049]|nr:hypothetical protein DL98DRAFT_521485 [Cadophora sp. DSE1049]